MLINICVLQYFLFDVQNENVHKNLVVFFLLLILLCYIIFLSHVSLKNE